MRRWVVRLSVLVAIVAAVLLLRMTVFAAKPVSVRVADYLSGLEIDPTALAPLERVCLPFATGRACGERLRSCTSLHTEGGAADAPA